MPRRALSVCSAPGCPNLSHGGRCSSCRTAAEQQRGNPTQRGYGREHQQRFRPGVLAKDPICVLCNEAPSVIADHWPHSRRELVEQGVDPDDPRYGRGLCRRCDSRQTAARQPGGFRLEA